MHIVHTEASCGWGGQELRILSEASGMIARGHRVSVLCAPESRIFAEAPRHGVPAIALPVQRKRLGGALALRRWLARHPADVINTHSSTDAWLAALAVKGLRSPPPLVRTRHISAPFSRNATTRWLYGRAHAHVVTTGEALRREFVERLGLPADHVTSVPTGIDTARFAPGDRREARRSLGLDVDRRYVGILATLRSWKGHLDLLEAFATLGAPGAVLLVVGDGPMRGVLEERCAELRLGEAVRFAGQRDDPQDWLRAMDVFCLPSYANEGVPQALLQAMLTGLPIVTTPVGSITEAVADGESALVVPPRQPDRLARALRRLLEDGALCSQLGARAREVALERFGREAMLDRMETIFRALARKGGG